MNTIKQVKHSLLVIICTAFLAFGCSTDATDSESTTINGSVNGESSQQKAKNSSVEGAVVTAARVTSSGSVETINGTETETNASGYFTLNMDTETAEHIVIVAEKEGQSWSGFLSGRVENGNTYTLKPIDTESTAETEVFTYLVASGSADLVQKSDVEAVVTNRVSAEIESSTSAASRIATGLKNAAQARAEYYSQTFESESEAALEATFDALAEAQFRLESELEASASAEAREEAYDVFIESVINAYINAGLTASQAATSIEMWSRVFVNSLTSVSSDVKDDARMNVSLVAAAAIDLATQAEAEANGMSESSRQAIINAGLELRSAIRASAGVASEVRAAFEAYHEEVRSTMESDASFETSIIIEVDGEINSLGGAKSVFNSSIATAVSASVVNEIYGNFRSSIYGIAEALMEGSNETEVEAISRMILLINLAS